MVRLENRSGETINSRFLMMKMISVNIFNGCRNTAKNTL